MGLRRYIAKRVVQALFVAWMVISVVFLAVRLTPGSPVTLVVGREASAEMRQAAREDLGLNLPMHEQYIRWISDVVTGDLGYSYTVEQPVTQLIAQSITPTVSVGVLAILIALGIGIPTGLISAVKKDTNFDYLSTLIAFAGISMPAFWIGILLIVFISTNIPWMPVFGYATLDSGFVNWFSHLILPALAVALPNGGVIMRFTRDSMLEVLNNDYMRTARAKGLSQNLILFKHGMQNGLIPVVTVVGIMMGALLAGVVAVEIVFGYAGLGRLLINSIMQNDYPIVQGTIILLALWFVFMNLFVDLIYTTINPRIRYGERGG